MMSRRTTRIAALAAALAAVGTMLVATASASAIPIVAVPVTGKLTFKSGTVITLPAGSSFTGTATVTGASPLEGTIGGIFKVPSLTIPPPPLAFHTWEVEIKAGSEGGTFKESPINSGDVVVELPTAFSVTFIRAGKECTIKPALKLKNKTPETLATAMAGITEFPSPAGFTYPAHLAGPTCVNPFGALVNFDFAGAGKYLINIENLLS